MVIEGNLECEPPKCLHCAIFEIRDADGNRKEGALGSYM